MNTDKQAFALLHKAHQIARDAFNGELTATQYLILDAIREHGDGVNQTQLVNATGIDRSTMADVLRRMERGGMISKTVSPQDNRSNEISLTQEGRDALLRASEAAARADEAILGVIPESQRRTFLRHLERIGKGPVQAVKVAA